MSRGASNPAIRAAPAPARRWIGAWVVAVVVAVVFVNTLANGFNYDDEANIIENPHFRGLGWANLAWMFTTFHMGHYQPLTWISLALDHMLWGEQPLGYHLTNLALHVANAVLVYLLALRLLAAARGPARLEIESLPLAAAVAALFFAIHPLRVESVAWITERRDVLSSFFLLVTAWLYLRACRVELRGGPWRLLAVIALALSLLSRAMGVTLPLILLLLDWYPLRRLTGTTWRRVLVEKIPFVVLAIGFAAIAPLAQQSAGATLTLEEHGALARVAQACYGLVFYLWKTLVPLGLAPLYFLTTPLRVTSAKYVIAVIVVALLAAVVWYGRKRRPGLVVVALTYVVLLAPVLGLVQSGRQEVADRYSYLPAIGWALLLGAVVWRVWSRPPLRLPTVVVCAAVLLTLGVLTWRQTAIWRSPETLWTHAVAQAPSPTAHQNLAAVYAQTQRLPAAIEQYRAALALEPRHEKSLYGLAKALNDARRYDEALEVWQQLVVAAPQDERVCFQYAQALRALGRLDEAATHYLRAIALQPNALDARMNLGGIRLAQGRVTEAIAELTLVTDQQPGSADALYNLGNALLAAGRAEEAASVYQRALQARPDFPEAGTNYALTLARLGRREEARQTLQRVLGQHPSFEPARRAMTALTPGTGPGANGP